MSYSCLQGTSDKLIVILFLLQDRTKFIKTSKAAETEAQTRCRGVFCVGLGCSFAGMMGIQRRDGWSVDSLEKCIYGWEFIVSIRVYLFLSTLWNYSEQFWNSLASIYISWECFQATLKGALSCSSPRSLRINGTDHHSMAWVCVSENRKLPFNQIRKHRYFLRKNHNLLF